MSTFLEYPRETAVSRRMIRDMAAEDRPLTRARLAGLSKLSTAELLALVLDTPDALDLARDMLDHAGTLIALYQLNTAELATLPGVGATRAAQVKAAIELGRRSMLPPADKRPCINSPADAAALLLPEMGALTQEQLRVILLDTRTRVIDVTTVYQGSLNTAVVRIAEIFKPAIVQNAAAIILAHNHPSNDPSPSPHDVTLTQAVAAVGGELSITLLDHIIVAGSGFVSLQERGLMGNLA